MAHTDIDSEDQLVQATFAEHLEKVLGWESVYAWNDETFGSENHRYMFSLIHKFNEDVNPREPYSTRDDIIVVSDEAHRTQAGKLARNMRLALPSASFIGFTYAERHDNLEAIYKKLEERRDIADVSDLLKELHRIVNEAVRAAKPGDDQVESKLFDLSHIDLAKLQEEFAKKAKRKATVIEDIRQIVERKLAGMLARNPQRMDYYRKYSEIVADYNREKDRWTEKEQTQAEVEVFILDHLFAVLPTPPFTPEDKQTVAKRVYQHIWQQSANPQGAAAA